MIRSFCLSLILSAGLIPLSAPAATVTFNFDGVTDGTPAGTLYVSQGLSISSGVVLQSGAFGGSLNEFEFPPNSGEGVFLNEADTTRMIFAGTITSFEAFFTYGGPITLSFYDGTGSLLTSIQSAFSTNLGLSGEPGSLPNERLAVASLANARRIEIEAPNADFTMDDLTVTLVAIPEPAAAVLAATGLALALAARAFRHPQA